MSNGPFLSIMRSYFGPDLPKNRSGFGPILTWKWSYMIFGSTELGKECVYVPMFPDILSKCLVHFGHLVNRVP